MSPWLPHTPSAAQTRSSLARVRLANGPLVVVQVRTVCGVFAYGGFLPSWQCFKFKPPSVRHEWPVASNVETTTIPIKLPSRSASVTQPPSSSSSALEVQHASAPSETEDRPQSESESASASAPLITPTLTPSPALSCTDDIPELPSPSQSIPDSQPLAPKLLLSPT
jgi:hypothetical protein